MFPKPCCFTGWDGGDVAGTEKGEDAVAHFEPEGGEVAEAGGIAILYRLLSRKLADD